MRASVLGAFVIGLVLGAAVLSGALWYAGDIRWPLGAWGTSPQAQAATPGATSGATPGATPAAPPQDTSLPAMSNAPKQPPLVPPPADLPQTVAPQQTTGQATPQGDAERTTTAAFPDHPIAPITGVDTSQLKDTFNDMRDGHKHEALDIPAAKDTPVVAAVEGNVAKLFTSKQGGITVYQFDDSQQYCYYYAHLDRYAPGLKEGTLLRKGQVLGFVGSTGDAQAAGPHLHFAIFQLGPEKHWWQGKAVDPAPLLK
jgi:murein DD-endopeptidase MepM/ murein hydrolase activator NlpD